MPQQYSFVGQRADKISVEVAVSPDEVDESDVIDGRIPKKVEHYTMTCPEPDCDGIGRYDNLGQVICQDCGMVISGDNEASLAVDYSGSRGFTGKRDDADADHHMGITEPSV